MYILKILNIITYLTMVNFLIFMSSISMVLAMPHLMDDPHLLKTAREILERQTPGAVQISQAEGNCGPTPCVGFSEGQLISTTGDHAFQSPAPGDIRGPCPGRECARYLMNGHVLSC